MTTYQVCVADEVLARRDEWRPIRGFRLLSIDRPSVRYPDATICTFEDSDAPAEFEGKLVEPIFRTENGDLVTIDGRILRGGEDAR